MHCPRVGVEVRVGCFPLLPSALFLKNIHIHIYIHTHIRAHIHIYIHMSYTYTHIAYAYTHTHNIYTYVYPYIHIYISIYMSDQFIYFICLNVLPAHVYVHHECVSCA